jgi:hypothetical protein
MSPTFKWLIIGAAVGFIAVVLIHLVWTALPAWGAALITVLTATISGSTGGLGLGRRDSSQADRPKHPVPGGA